MRSLSFMSMSASLLVLGACQRAEEPAAPANTAPVDAAAAAAPVTTIVAEHQTFQCGDLVVTATFDGVSAVDLSYPGGPLTLPQVESASGARFADRQGNEFWSKGEQATFTLAAQENRNCVPANLGS